MLDQFSRTGILLGEENMKKLKNSRVAVFGIGGVGGHAAEALVRSGIGEIDLFDNDTVSVTNINRQAVAVLSTVGMDKVEAARLRFSDINPELKITCHKMFFLPDTELDLSFFDYVVDAIDTVSGKIELAMRCDKLGVPIISSMGAGNKLEPASFEVADIYKTSVCPLARVMRTELKKREVKKLKVVYSKEKPRAPLKTDEESVKRQIPGSTAFTPAVAGLIMASEVIKDITGEYGQY